MRIVAGTIPSTLVILAACAHRSPDGPAPTTCDPPDALPETLFTDRTSEVGIATARGNQVIATDLDGDGWVDLVLAPNSQVWKNLGGRFEDVSATSGLPVLSAAGEKPGSVVSGDVDNDGDVDLFLGTWAYAGEPGMHRVFLNDGKGHFTEAPKSDVNYRSTATSASFVDYDRDGFLDLWIVSWYEFQQRPYPASQDRLLRGHGDGTFTDVTDDVGLKMGSSFALEDELAGTSARPGMGATACDVDGDGDDDLLASIYGRQDNQQWRNDGGQFVDVATASTFAADDLLDYRQDQSYICWCMQHPGACNPMPGPTWMPERCAEIGEWWNPGETDQPANLGGNTFTTVCGDIDRDGDLDLFNTEIVHSRVGDSSDPTQLLLNDGTGTWTRPGRSATGLDRPRVGAWNEGDLMGAFLDVDNDGMQDIYLGESDYPDTRAHLFRQERTLWFHDLFPAAGIDFPRAKGIAIADFDHDGDLDLVIGASLMRGGPWKEPEVHYFQNELGRSHWIELDLEGTKANRLGIGAWVTVESGGNKQLFELQGGYGHGGIENSLTLHVGLGDRCMADKVTVRWPTPAQDTDTTVNLQGDRRWRLREGEATPHAVDRMRTPAGARTGS